MILLILYLLLLATAGIALMRWVHGSTVDAHPALLLDSILGPAIVLGLSSCSLFMVGLAFDALRPWGIIVEVVLLLGLTAGLIYGVGWPTVSCRPRGPAASASSDAKLHRLLIVVLWLAFLALLLADLLVFVRLAGERPHGNWDAWGVWNLRARFFFGATHDWAYGALHHTQFHSDYPLLLPLTVTRFWSYLGNTSILVPQSLGIASLVALTLLLMGALATLRSWSQALLAGLALLATGFPVELATWQYADIPLTFFILGSCVLVCMADHPGATRERALMLAGTCASLAAWTKNEGILFLIVLGVAKLMCTLPAGGVWRAGRELVWMVVGGLPVLGVLVGFKWAFGTPNDLLAGQNMTETLYRLVSWDRYTAIAGLMAEKTEALFGLLPVLLLLLAVVNQPRPRTEIGRGSWVVALSLAGLALGYFFVMVSTPYPLDWHLKTAGRRLLLHIWPTVLFLFFMLVSTTEESVEKRRSVPLGASRA